MKCVKSYVVILCVAALPIGVTPGDGRSTHQTASDNSSVLGDWRGESICVVRESACHDEDSLYHVTKLPEKPGWISMKLDKIVNGKPVTMGVMDCSYSAANRSLACEFPRGIMRFTVNDNKMEGTMTLPDGTLWRKISLKKTSES